MRKTDCPAFGKNLAIRLAGRARIDVSVLSGREDHPGPRGTRQAGNLPPAARLEGQMMMAYRRNHSRVPATAERLERVDGYDDADGCRVRVVAYRAKGSYWLVHQRLGGKSAAFMDGWRTDNEQQFTGKTAGARFNREMDAARALLTASLPEDRDS